MSQTAEIESSLRRFVILNRGRHWAMVEHANVFNRYVVDFLSH